MQFEVTNCSAIPVEDLCAAINLAFSDYPIPLQMTVSAFEDFQRQRGFSAQHSFVARAGEDIAAFWFASAPLSDYGLRSYTLSTGTVPDYRRKGLIKTLFKSVSESCRSSDALGLQHEVISTNKGAITAYEAMGFQRVRDLLVYKIPAKSFAGFVPAGFELRSLEFSQLPEHTPLFEDVQATPQNSRSAIAAIPAATRILGAYLTEGALVGWCAAFENGSAAQIAVRTDVRRQGIGTALVGKLARALNVDQLTFVNVDAQASSLTAFLPALGGAEVLRQFEMQLNF